jgi:phenylpropionate dioxygenase-like ring-hydroxylating dioxygenase large terminal subunit
MHKSRQIELVDRLTHPDPYVKWSYAAASMRNPVAHYIDLAWFEDERQALFHARPLFAGLSAECAGEGSYITRDCGGIPVGIVRQRDGTLAAFVNICSHRGATILKDTGPGSLRRIVCPYHAWTYDLAGKLLARPQSDDAFADIGRDCDLAPRAVQEKHGLIFVHPTSNEAFDVDTLLCGMEREFAEYGIESAHHIETRVSTWDMNWKLLLDSFLEPYHVRYLHRKTIDPVFFPHQLYDSFGAMPRVIGLRRTIMEQLAAPRDSWRLFPDAAAVYVLMPNALLTYQGDHLETWRIEPIDAKTTRAYTTIFSPEPPQTEKAMQYWMKNLEVLCNVAMNEDFPCQLDIQRNMRSGAIREVVYGRLEPALIQFHSTINTAVEAWRAKQEAVLF